MKKIPGIDKPLTKRQRAAAEKRIGEVPFLFRGALKTAVETGYLPGSTAALIKANAENSIGAQVIDELCAL